MRSSRRPSQRGVALPMALFTLVIAAVMITAVFYVGRLEQRMGNNSIASTQAFEAAETGVSTALSGWSSSAYNSLSIGSTVVLPPQTVARNAVQSTTIRRLNGSMFLIQSEGRFAIAGTVITRRQVARLVRQNLPFMDPSGALVTRLGMDINGSALVNGRDSLPPGWGPYCGSLWSMRTAISDSAGLVTTSGPCASQACLTGNPPYETAPQAVTTSQFQDYGTETFSSLSASADKIVSGTLGSLGPTFDAGSPAPCRLDDLQNWGDPLNPASTCGQYWPVIYAPGDLTLNGGWGQGLLLVQGNLTLAGPVQFYGIIIVNGTISGTGGQVIGALLIYNEFGQPATVSGTQVYWSHCAITRALEGAAKPIPIRDRSWAQLY
jgi:hypothetical protein